MWIFWKNVKSLSLSPKQPKKKKKRQKKKEKSIISILFSEGTWRLSAQATIFGENLVLPQWIPSRKVRNKHPQAEPQYTENLIKIWIFYHWNRLHYWIYALYNIIRPFISNIPFPMLLREDKWVATDLSSFYFSGRYSNIWKRQASLWGCICQMLRKGVAHWYI